MPLTAKRAFRSMGVDVATKTGLAVLEEPVAKSSRPRTCLTRVATAGSSGLERARSIAAQVVKVAVDYDPQVIVVEGYGFANRHSLADLVEVGTLVRDRLWKNGLEWHEVAPTQLKKFVLGKGSGKKDEMRLGVFKRWGFEDPSADVVDAYGLAALGLALGGHLPGLIEPQRDVVSRVLATTEGKAT